MFKNKVEKLQAKNSWMAPVLKFFGKATYYMAFPAIAMRQNQAIKAMQYYQGTMRCKAENRLRNLMQQVLQAEVPIVPLPARLRYEQQMAGTSQAYGLATPDMRRLTLTRGNGEDNSRFMF